MGALLVTTNTVVCCIKLVFGIASPFFHKADQIVKFCMANEIDLIIV